MYPHAVYLRDAVLVSLVIDVSLELRVYLLLVAQGLRSAELGVSLESCAAILRRRGTNRTGNCPPGLAKQKVVRSRRGLLCLSNDRYPAHLCAAPSGGLLC